MNEYTLSQAMTDIPDDWLTDAPQAKRRHRVYAKLLRVAACFAVMVGLLLVDFRGGDGIVTRPGLLTITVSAADLGILSSDAPEIILYSPLFLDSRTSNIGRANPFTPSIPNADGEYENLRFQISAENGALGIREFAPNLPSVTVVNNTPVYWTPTVETYFMDCIISEEETPYIDILIYDGDNLIGYAVLELGCATCEEVGNAFSLEVVHPDSWIPYDPDDPFSVTHAGIWPCYYCYSNTHLFPVLFSVKRLESVCFPKVDGEYQYIPEEYVSGKIAAFKSRK